MINFLHNFNPQPILISAGPIDIHWYGLLIMVGFFIALLISIKLGEYYAIKKDQILDLAFWLIVVGLLGARIYHVFLELPYYLNYPLNIFKIWEGGLAIHGGIIAGLIVLYYFTKKQKINFWLMASVLVPGLAFAQAIGRWGNYFNQELFGLPTNLPWGIPINIINRPIEYSAYQYFHPTFLYESIGNFLIFLILISIHVWIIKSHSKQNKNNNCYILHIPCYILCVMYYALFYSLLRFSTEFLRIDQTPTLLGWRWPQIASIIIILISAGYLLKYRKNYVNIIS